MRGRTLNDSFVILDEAQNATAEQMKMFLTRLGFHSKVVVTGDITQIDLPSERVSGLIEVKESCAISKGLPSCISMRKMWSVIGWSRTLSEPMINISLQLVAIPGYPRARPRRNRRRPAPTSGLPLVRRPEAPRAISLVVRIPHAHLLQLFRDDIHEGSALMAVYVLERLTRVRVRQAALRRLAERVLSGVGEAQSELSIDLVGDGRMRGLNRQYRKKVEPPTSWRLPCESRPVRCLLCSAMS